MLTSRRAVLASALALPLTRLSGVTVTCGLEESRKAFGHLRFMRQSRLQIVESTVGLSNENLAWLQMLGMKVHGPKLVNGPAWIRFNWPIPVLIRDFGRICPVSGGTTIAWLDKTPVAARSGRLVVLGTPLGPHIYSGDVDAQAILTSLLKA